MKKTLTRILSLILALVTVCGLMIAPASAASATSGASLIKVDTSGGKFVVVTTPNAKIRTDDAFYSSVYVTASSGTLLKINGSSNNYYKVKLGNTNYFIAKSDCKAAGNSFKASIDYTVIDKAAFRTGPAQAYSIAYKPAKGTAFLTVGTLRNNGGKGNLWSVVYDTSSRSLTYLYSGNSACVCANATLTVTGSTNTINICDTLQLSASSSVGLGTITWTSTNPAVASVDANGVVRGHTAGTVNIIARGSGLGGAIDTAFAVTVTPQVRLNVDTLRQYDSRWKNKYIAKSNATIGKYGCTLTSLAMVYSYDTGKTVTPDVMDDLLKFTSGGAVYWDSVSALGYNRHSYSLAAIYAQLKQGNPVIIGGKNSKGGTHWVVITGYTGTSATNFKASSFTINDPGNSSRTTLQHYLNSYPIVSTLVY